MAPNTRKFLVGSALVVAAGLCTGLVAYYSGVLPGRDAASSELAYIPADVSAVGFADVRHIMDSEFRQKLRSVMPTGAEKDRLHDATGIDVERDIDVVVAGLSADGTPGGVVILRGQFDQARIENVALAHGARQEQYGGRAMLLAPARDADGADALSHGPAHHVPSLAFLDDGLLAVGDVEDLRRAIDVAATGAGVSNNADMMRVIDSVRGAGDAWLVGRADRMVNQPGLPEQLRGQFGGITWLSVAARIDSSVRGLVRAEARDEQSAEDLRAMLNGALAAARMFAGQDPRAAAALGSVQTSGTGLNIELSFEVPSTVLDMVPPGLHAPAGPSAARQ